MTADFDPVLEGTLQASVKDLELRSCDSHTLRRHDVTTLRELISYSPAFLRREFGLSMATLRKVLAVLDYCGFFRVPLPQPGLQSYDRVRWSASLQYQSRLEVFVQQQAKGYGAECVMRSLKAVFKRHDQDRRISIWQNKRVSLSSRVVEPLPARLYLGREFLEQVQADTHMARNPDQDNLRVRTRCVCAYCNRTRQGKSRFCRRCLHWMRLENVCHQCGQRPATVYTSRTAKPRLCEACAQTDPLTFPQEPRYVFDYYGDPRFRALPTSESGRLCDPQ
jgi:hypothetical protein